MSDTVPFLFGRPGPPAPDNAAVAAHDIPFTREHSSVGGDIGDLGATTGRHVGAVSRETPESARAEAG